MNHLIEVEVKNEGKENARLKAYFEAVKETARKNATFCKKILTEQKRRDIV